MSFCSIVIQDSFICELYINLLLFLFNFGRNFYFFKISIIFLLLLGWFIHFMDFDQDLSTNWQKARNQFKMSSILVKYFGIRSMLFKGKFKIFQIFPSTISKTKWIRLRKIVGQKHMILLKTTKKELVWKSNEITKKDLTEKEREKESKEDAELARN